MNRISFRDFMKLFLSCSSCCLWSLPVGSQSLLSSSYESVTSGKHWKSPAMPASYSLSAPPVNGLSTSVSYSLHWLWVLVLAAACSKKLLWWGFSDALVYSSKSLRVVLLLCPFSLIIVIGFPLGPLSHLAMGFEPFDSVWYVVCYSMAFMILLWHIYDQWTCLAMWLGVFTVGRLILTFPWW